HSRSGICQARQSVSTANTQDNEMSRRIYSAPRAKNDPLSKPPLQSVASACQHYKQGMTRQGKKKSNIAPCSPAWFLASFNFCFAFVCGKIVSDSSHLRGGENESQQSHCVRQAKSGAVFGSRHWHF